MRRKTMDAVIWERAKRLFVEHYGLRSDTHAWARARLEARFEWWDRALAQLFPGGGR